MLLHFVLRPPAVLAPAVLAVPPDRGRLLTAAQVAAELFSGTVSAAWVRRTVPGKLRLGHSTVRYYEHDVRAWIAAQQD